MAAAGRSHPPRYHAQVDTEFQIPEEILGAYGLEDAHIELLAGGRTNRTLRARAGRDLVLQQLLGKAHSDLLGIMENLVRVTSHLDWRRVVDKTGPSWYPLLMPTNDGKPFIMTEAGDVWRAFHYQSGRIVRSTQPYATLASAGAIYGKFAAATVDLGGPPLIDTLPDFHDLDAVYHGLLSELEESSTDVRDTIGPELDRLDALKTKIDGRCSDDGVTFTPRRVVHNDTKLSNVLFDRDHGRATAVLDLDLVMMGPCWHDVGDLIRSASWHATESSEPTCPVELFDAVVGAFVEAAGDTLSEAEISTFAAAGPRLSFELGLRYLHDHLRETPHLSVMGHNGHLRRGFANVRLAEEMLDAYDALRLKTDDFLVER